MALAFARPDLYREHLLRCAGPPVRRRRRAALVARAHRAAACARAAPTTCCGCPTPSRTTCGAPATGRCSTCACRSSKRPRSRPASTRRYGQPAASRQSGTLYEHCVRAIERGLTVGAHGLPLIGTGDWNDGMNRVGHAGPRRERVARLVPVAGSSHDFAAIVEARGDAARAAALARRARAHARDARAGVGRRLVSPRLLRRRHAAGLRADSRSAASTRSRRAGRCSRAPRRAARAERAMDAVRMQLVRRDAGVILLLAPPVRPVRARSRATSRATCPACARTAASTRTPRSGR